MKTLYLDCGMGAAGDMLTAALLELLPEPAAFVEELNNIGIPRVTFRAMPSQKCGITGTHMAVLVDGADEHMLVEHGHEHHHAHEHDHHHSGMGDIETVIRGLKISDWVKADALVVYGLIAEAESHAHGRPVTEIHFHEVGTMDAVADVVAVCLLMERLAPDKVIASPVHVGSGTVRCAHGILPIPAPATAYILRDVPIYGGEIRGELCTPTGAALLKHFATSFGAMPLMQVSSIGHGMGSKDFPVANCVRAMLGESGSAGHDLMYELSANVDDMTAEELGFAMERLFAAGAAEVYTVPIGMKKNRPGTLLRIICSEAVHEDMVRVIFQTTSTIGIRETETRRYVLNRQIETRDTYYGPVRVKRSEGHGVVREKIEYEDVAAFAREWGISLAEARQKLEKEAGIHGA